MLTPIVITHEFDMNFTSSSEFSVICVLLKLNVLEESFTIVGTNANGKGTEAQTMNEANGNHSPKSTRKRHREHEILTCILC